jgi:pimeloyl-ACP methyl ester carboxylesterase
MDSLESYPYYISKEGWSAMMAWYDCALASLPIPYRAHYVETPYGETHVLTAGAPYAPPMVVLHGINVNALNWKAQIVNLSPYYHVIAPDIPGFAGKSAPNRLSYHNDDYAHWLRCVLDAFGISSAIIAGSSGGGYFALKYAAVYPEQTSRLILVNPCGISRYPYPLDFGRKQRIVNWIGRFGRSVASYERARKLVAMSASKGITPDETTVEMAYILLKYFKRAAPPGSLPLWQFRQISVPTLLLLGEHEPYFNIRYLKQEAEGKLIHADLYTVILQGAGHDLHNDRAQEVSNHILQFTQQVKEIS